MASRAHTARTGISLAILALGVLPLASCESGTEPSPAQVAVIRVADETFRIALTTPGLLEAAQAAMAGTGPTIPNGRIVAGTDVNVGYSWHLEDVEFAEVAIELCDGRPSDVEAQGTSFANGRYCPWGAEVNAIQ